MTSIEVSQRPGGPVMPARPGAPARVVMGLIRAYQVARTGRVSPCRFTPTCSQYARRGGGLAARRLARCRPGGPSGYDPVPE